MANSSLISIRVLDDGGRAGNINVFVPATATLAQIQAFVNAFVPSLDTITGAKIDAASVALNLTLPGPLKPNAIADHPLEYGANFSYDAANTPYRHTIHVPSIDQGLVDGGAVNVGHALVLAFNTHIVDGTVDIDPSDRYANDLTSFLGASVSFRKV